MTRAGQNLVSKSPKSKILYDGNCVVCDLEIMHYKRVAPELFECIDISSAEFRAQDYGVTKAAVDRDMHVITPEGQLTIGVDAFAHIWQRLGVDKRHYRLMSKAIRSAVVYPCAKVFYSIFTQVRPYLPKKQR